MTNREINYDANKSYKKSDAMNSIGCKTQARSKAATERKAQEERTHNTKLSLIRLINNIKLKPDQIVNIKQQTKLSLISN